MASQCNIAVTKASKDITLAVRQLDAAVSQAESSKKEIEAKDAYKSHTALFEAHSKELARRINLATLICGRKKPVEPAVPGAPAGLAQAAQPAPVAPALQQPLPTAITAALAGFTFAPVTNGTLLMPQKELDSEVNKIREARDEDSLRQKTNHFQECRDQLRELTKSVLTALQDLRWAVKTHEKELEKTSKRAEKEESKKKDAEQKLRSLQQSGQQQQLPQAAAARSTAKGAQDLADLRFR